MTITVRKANDDEKLNVNPEEKLPAGVRPFDDCHFDNHIFHCLREGDFVVEVTDPDGIIKWQSTGTFLLQKTHDFGFLKKI